VIDEGAGPLPDPDHYRRFGEPHDRRVLEAARRRGAITVLHAEGAPPALEGLATLPADLWSGGDRRAGVSIRERLSRVPGALIAGLDAATLRCGTAAEAKAQAQEAIVQAGGLGLVLGPGSGLLVDTPDASLVELARSLGGQVSLGLIKPQG
jgi:Uroporphyrinogen decarboxylase (URO-D)